MESATRYDSAALPGLHRVSPVNPGLEDSAGATIRRPSRPQNSRDATVFTQSPEQPMNAYSCGLPLYTAR